MIQIQTAEETAALRRVYFQCVDETDGLTPEAAEAGGQPQISINGVAWTNTGIGVLVAIAPAANGRYYGQLTQTVVSENPRTVIESRYKSADTAEAIGTTVQIINDTSDQTGSLVTIYRP